MTLLVQHAESSLALGVLVALLVATIVLFVAVPRLAAVSASWDVDCTVASCVSMPTWLPERALAEVMAGIGTLDSINLDDQLSGQELERALLTASPWFREVQRASKVYPRKLALRVSLRRPVALVDNGGELIPVDREGAVLPRSAATIPAEGGQPLPRVRGCEEINGAETTPGRLLQLPELREGLAVAEEIVPLRSLVTVVVIDVLNVPRPGGPPTVAGRPEITLETSEGVSLWWGRSRRSPNFGALEVPVEAKVQNLRRVLEKYPGLNGLSAVILHQRQPSLFPRQVSQGQPAGEGGEAELAPGDAPSRRR